MRLTVSWIMPLFVASIFTLTEPKRQDTVGGIRKVTYRVVSPTSTEIRWRDPSRKQKKNGGSKPNSSKLYAIRYGSQQDMYRTVLTPARRYVLKGLTAGTTYDVKVRWVSGARSGTWSKNVKVKLPPISQQQNASIQNLKATPKSPYSVELSWTLYNPTNQEIVSVSVTAELANGGKRRIRASIAPVVSSYNVTDLLPSMMYRFVITPVLKEQSMPVMGARVTAKPFTDRPSRAPRIIKAEVVNKTFIQLKWMAPPVRSRNGPLTGYKIQVRPHDSKRVPSYMIDKSARMFVVKDLDPGKKYKIRVSAMNINGSGPASKWIYVKTIGPNSLGQEQSVVVTHGVKESNDDVNDLTTTSSIEATEGNITNTTGVNQLPETPNDIRVVNTTSSGAIIHWSIPYNHPCCPIVAYRLTIVNLNDSSTFDLVRGTTKVHVYGLDPSTSYSIKISSLNRFGRSEVSSEICFNTLPAAPTIITNLSGPRVLEGGHVNLTCVARGHQAPNFTWQIGGLVIQEPLDENKLSGIAGKLLLTSSTFGENGFRSSLLLYNVTQAAEKNFTCVAINSIGSENQTVSLVVSVPPSIVSVRGTRVKIGMAAQLECVTSGKPIPQIIWRHSNSGTVYKEMRVSNQTANIYVESEVQGRLMRRSFLLVENTDYVHGGVYTCMAVNDVGHKNTDVSLDVEVPPPPPVEDIQAIPVSSTRVSVLWRPPGHYPYPIHYYQVSFKLPDDEDYKILQTRRIGVELSNLKPNSSYVIGVVAATKYGLGEPGSKVDIRTLTEVGLEPVNVSAIAINSTTIQLDWQTPTSVPVMFLQGYNVYFRADKDPKGRRVFIPGGSSKQYLIGLGKEDTYFVRISTVTTWGFEAFAPWIRLHKYAYAFLPPNPVRDITTTSELREITVRWKEPLSRPQQRDTDKTRLIGYHLSFHRLHFSANVTEIHVPPKTKTYTLQALAPSTVYVVSLQAANDHGESEPIYVYPSTKSLPPSIVQHAKASPLSSTKIHIKWKHPRRGTVTRYHIRYWRPGKKGKQSAWVSGRLTDYVAGSLKKNTNYRFELIPYDGERPGEAVIIFASTMTDKPDGPPNDVRLAAVNATTLLATWSPPDQDKSNGKIMGYRLVVKKMNGKRVANFQVDGSRRKYTLLNMQSSTGYKLRIAAIGVNGTGVFSAFVETTYDKAPQRPANPENVSIIATDSSLLVQWEEPNFTGSPIFGYVVGYGKFIPDVFQKVVDSTDKSFNITRLKPNSDYIVSVRAFNSIGESIPVYRFTRTLKGPVVAPPILPPVQLTVQSHSLTSLILTWTDPALAKYPDVEDSRFYQVRYSPVEGEAYSYRNASNTNLTLDELQTDSRYEVSVRTMRGKEISDWSMTVVNSTKQFPPAFAPTNIKTFMVNGSPSSLALNWSAPQKGGGKIEEYIIHLSADQKLSPSRWVVLTTDQTQATIRELTPHTVYYLKLQSKNKAGYGPLSDTIIYRPVVDMNTAPTIVSVSSIHGNASTTTEVVWKRPQRPDGIITAYMLHYRQYDPDNVRGRGDWTARLQRGLDAVIMGLEENTTYLFKVQAVNKDSVSPMSDVVEFTTPVLDERFMEQEDEEDLDLSEGNDNKKDDNIQQSFRKKSDENKKKKGDVTDRRGRPSKRRRIKNTKRPGRGRGAGKKKLKRRREWKKNVHKSKPFLTQDRFRFSKKNKSGKNNGKRGFNSNTKTSGNKKNNAGRDGVSENVGSSGNADSRNFINSRNNNNSESSNGDKPHHDGIYKNVSVVVVPTINSDNSNETVGLYNNTSGGGYGIGSNKLTNESGSGFVNVNGSVSSGGLLNISSNYDDGNDDDSVDVNDTEDDDDDGDDDIDDDDEDDDDEEEDGNDNDSINDNSDDNEIEKIVNDTMHDDNGVDNKKRVDDNDIDDGDNDKKENTASDNNSDDDNNIDNNSTAKTFSNSNIFNFDLSTNLTDVEDDSDKVGDP